MKYILLVVMVMFCGCSLAKNYCDNRQGNTLTYSLSQANPLAYKGLDMACEGVNIASEAKNIYNEIIVENNLTILK